MNRKTLKNIKKLIQKNGGLTINHKLEMLKSKRGFMVALADYEKKLNIKDLTIDLLKEYLKVAKDKKAFVGFWLDGSTLYLDISYHLLSESSALIFGRLNHQLAIYDLSKNESIYL